MTSQTDERTGRARQLVPEVEQVVGAEQQLPQIPGEIPVIQADPIPELPITGPARIVQAGVLPGQTPQEAFQTRILTGLPVLFSNRYQGTDTDWQMLARWDIVEGGVGELHEISLATSNASKTRYRIVIAGREMSLPDRQVAALQTFPWRDNNIPGPTEVTVEVRSTETATSIIVDGFITGTER